MDVERLYVAPLLTHIDIEGERRRKEENHTMDNANIIKKKKKMGKSKTGNFAVGTFSQNLKKRFCWVNKKCSCMDRYERYLKRGRRLEPQNTKNARKSKRNNQKAWRGTFAHDITRLQRKYEPDYSSYSFVQSSDVKTKCDCRKRYERFVQLYRKFEEEKERMMKTREEKLKEIEKNRRKSAQDSMNFEERLQKSLQYNSSHSPKLYEDDSEEAAVLNESIGKKYQKELQCQILLKDNPSLSANDILFRPQIFNIGTQKSRSRLYIPSYLDLQPVPVENWDCASSFIIRTRIHSSKFIPKAALKKFNLCNMGYDSNSEPFPLEIKTLDMDMLEDVSGQNESEFESLIVKHETLDPETLRINLYTFPESNRTEKCWDSSFHEQVPLSQYWTSGRKVEGGYRTGLSLSHESKDVLFSCDIFFREMLRFSESSDPFDCSLDAPCAWVEMPLDVICLDTTTEKQDATLEARARKGPLSERQLSGRIEKLSKYFETTYGRVEKFSAPDEAFFKVDFVHPASCQLDITRANKQMKQMDAAIIKERVKEGQKFTIWPNEGRWPSSSVVLPQRLIDQLNKSVGQLNRSRKEMYNTNRRIRQYFGVRV